MQPLTGRLSASSRRCTINDSSFAMQVTECEADYTWQDDRTTSDSTGAAAGSVTSIVIGVSALFNRQSRPVASRITRCTSQSLMYSLALSIDAVMAWASHMLELVNSTGHMKNLDFIETSCTASLHLMQREGAIHTRPADYFIRCIRQAAIM
ncbi:hypothetical protein OKW45_007475 [Paraburkholderia sp. WSM4175]|uniref:hypothetical protein n=1 Tax=Paraburkholderia sp. WSM4175 TaxID=2991072 RepID=UPI003D1A8D3E